jgi:hypothetical protein
MNSRIFRTTCGLCGSPNRTRTPRQRVAAVSARDAFGRTVWVTRSRPKVDRIACPWLIRRFVDPHAVFLFVAPVEVSAAGECFGGAAFDIEGAFWSDRSEHCHGTCRRFWPERSEACWRRGSPSRRASSGYSWARPTSKKSAPTRRYLAHWRRSPPPLSALCSTSLSGSRSIRSSVRPSP